MWAWQINPLAVNIYFLFLLFIFCNQWKVMSWFYAVEMTSFSLFDHLTASKWNKCMSLSLQGALSHTLSVFLYVLRIPLILPTWWLKPISWISTNYIPPCHSLYLKKVRWIPENVGFFCLCFWLLKVGPIIGFRMVNKQMPQCNSIHESTCHTKDHCRLPNCLSFWEITMKPLN